MRKMLLLSVVGIFVSSTALAGGGCSNPLSAEAGDPVQTVASDESQQTVSPSGQTKDDKS